MLAAALLGSTAGAWLSIGGFNAALSDRGGSYRVRAVTMAALTVSCAIALYLGTIAGNYPAGVIALTFFVALGSSLLRVWGNGGASVGGSTLSTFVIAIAYPSTQGDALGRSGFLVAGGLWAMVVALILWPLRPYRPARLAVSEAYDALALYIDQVADEVDRTLLHSSKALPAQIPVVRAALENTRVVLARLRRGRPGASRRGDQLIVVAEAADQIFGHIVGVAETIETIPRLERDPYVEVAIIEILHGIAKSLRKIAENVDSEEDAEPIEIVWNGDSIRERLASPGSRHAGGVASVHYLHAATIFDRAAQYGDVAANTLTALNGRSQKPKTQPVAPRVADQVDERTPLRVYLRAILNPGSLLFRYALRVAVVTASAVALSQAIGIKRGYWMTLTVIVILQPYTGVTSQRAVQRIIGTVLGGIITAALGALIHDPLAIMALAFIFVTCCVALLPVNYVAFSVFLTPTFVLLAEASAGDWHLARTRVLNTLLGGTLAWLGSRLLWPSPEANRLPGHMAESLRANKAYLLRVIQNFGDRSEAAGRSILNARRATGLTASNTDESFQRYLGEHSGRTDDLSSAMTFTTYMRRVTASIAALSLVRHGTERPDPKILEPFGNAVSDELERLADATENGRPPNPMPDIPVLTGDDKKNFPLLSARIERLVRQLATVHDAVERFTAPL
jgi:uncharacterized membrane protein YccC